MEVITIDEKNKYRLQKYIKQEIGFFGYEEDIELLKEGKLTEALAQKIFTKVMRDAKISRKLLQPEKNDEFREQIEEAFKKYDEISKPVGLEEYGFYDGSYSNMELEDVYLNMQTAFYLIELDEKRDTCIQMRNIASDVANSIDGIEKYKINLEKEEKEELRKVQTDLRSLLSLDKTDIEKIQDRINSYNSVAIKIWNDYLTTVNDPNNNEYRWVVHNLTKGELDGDFRYKYMSTSLITNNIMGLYSNSNYGLIIRPKHIVSASYKDTYTLNTRSDEDGIFNIRPPLMLPQEVEEKCIQQTISENGEMLNYDKESIYSELVVDDYKIEGIYYISNGEHELARNYDRAKKMADERGLPLIERDISKYRVEHGLEPMTEKMKNDFCRNILYKCCEEDKELYSRYMQYAGEFVKLHSNEFYENFVRIKEKGDFSKEDILKAFSEITRNDEHFKKVSENIDKMYVNTDEKKIINDENIINECGEIIRDKTESDNIQFECNKNIEKIELTFPQRIVQKMSNNKLLRRVPFIKKYINSRLNVLPEAKKKIVPAKVKDDKVDFAKNLKEMINGTESMITSNENSINEIEMKNKGIEDKQV